MGGRWEKLMGGGGEHDMVLLGRGHLAAQRHACLERRQASKHPWPLKGFCTNTLSMPRDSRKGLKSLS